MRYICFFIVCVFLALLGCQSPDTEFESESLDYPNSLQAYYLDEVLEDDYRVTESENVRLYSQLSEEDAENIALRLEQFRYVLFKLFRYENTEFGKNKLELYLLTNPEEFSRFQVGEHTIAFFYDTIGGSKAIVNFNNFSVDMTVLYHEFFHYFHRNHFEQKLPRWLDEGLAQYVASVQFTDEGAVLGSDRTFPKLNRATNKRYFETFESIIRSMNQLPQQISSSGTTPAERVFIYYRLNWYIADWMMDTKAGRAVYEDILHKFDNGEHPKSLFTADVKQQIQNHVRDVGDQTTIAFVNDMNFDVQHKILANAEALKRFDYLKYLLILETRYKEMNSTSWIGELTNVPDGQTRNFYLRNAALAVLIRDVVLFNKHLNNILKTNPNDVEALTLKANLYTVFLGKEKFMFTIRMSNSQYKSLALKYLERLDSADASHSKIEMYYLARYGGYALNGFENEIYERVKSSNTLQREPVAALDLVQALLTKNDLEIADKVIKRAKLWGDMQDASFREYVDRTELDYLAAKAYFEDQVSE